MLKNKLTRVLTNNTGHILRLYSGNVQYLFPYLFQIKKANEPLVAS